MGKDIMEGDSSDGDPANERNQPNIQAGLTQKEDRCAFLCFLSQ